MKRPHLIKDPEKRKRIAHFAAGVTMLLHAYENYESGHHSYKLFAIAGTILLVFALFHHTIEKKLPWNTLKEGDTIFISKSSLTNSIQKVIVGKPDGYFIYAMGFTRAWEGIIYNPLLIILILLAIMWSK